MEGIGYLIFLFYEKVQISVKFIIIKFKIEFEIIFQIYMCILIFLIIYITLFIPREAELYFP